MFVLKVGLGTRSDEVQDQLLHHLQSSCSGPLHLPFFRLLVLVFIPFVCVCVPRGRPGGGGLPEGGL